MCRNVKYIFTKLHKKFCVKSFIRSLFKKLHCKNLSVNYTEFWFYRIPSAVRNVTLKTHICWNHRHKK